MLTDSGPLIALLDKNDRHHLSCLAVVQNLPNAPLLTTWLCFTEAIYLLGEEGGYHFQERLRKLRRDGNLALLEFTLAEGDRMDALMAQYRNVPMDAADASLIAVAETRGYRRLFTIDGDFYIYRKVHIAELKESRTPEVLTVNGRAEVVMLDTETCEGMVEQLNHVKAVAARAHMARAWENAPPQEPVTEAEIQRREAVMAELVAETERLGLYR